MGFVKKFLKNEEGAVYVEYALLLGLIGLVVAAAATLLGSEISAVFTQIKTTLASAV